MQHVLGGNAHALERRERSRMMRIEPVGDAPAIAGVLDAIEGLADLHSAPIQIFRPQQSQLQRDRPGSVGSHQHQRFAIDQRVAEDIGLEAVEVAQALKIALVGPDQKRILRPLLERLTVARQHRFDACRDRA